MATRAGQSLWKQYALTPLPRSPRSFTTFIQTSKISMMQPKIPEGQDEAKIKGELEALIQNGWKLDEEQIRLEKTYYFKTYTKVIDFHHVIGVESKSKNHHSKMISEAGSLTVYWTTHHPRGLTVKDTLMAAFCDERAKSIGPVDQSIALKCGPPPSSQI